MSNSVHKNAPAVNDLTDEFKVSSPTLETVARLGNTRSNLVRPEAAWILACMLTYAGYP
jgi:hypothetical protein